MASKEDSPTKNRQVHRFAIYATVVFGAFVLGFVPMWLTARTRAGERDAAQQALRLAQIENRLAAGPPFRRAVASTSPPAKRPVPSTPVCRRSSVVVISAWPRPRGKRCRRSSPNAIK